MPHIQLYLQKNVHLCHTSIAHVHRDGRLRLLARTRMKASSAWLVWRLKLAGICINKMRFSLPSFYAYKVYKCMWQKLMGYKNQTRRVINCWLFWVSSYLSSAFNRSWFVRYTNSNHTTIRIGKCNHLKMLALGSIWMLLQSNVWSSF